MSPGAGHQRHGGDRATGSPESSHTGTEPRRYLPLAELSNVGGWSQVDAPSLAEAESARLVLVRFLTVRHFLMTLPQPAQAPTAPYFAAQVHQFGLVGVPPLEEDPVANRHNLGPTEAPRRSGGT